MLFAGPPERDFDWSDDQVEGAHRFLKRVWALAVMHQQATAHAVHPGPFEGKALEIRRTAHKCVKRVGEAIERLSFNTAIAGIMECVNTLYDAGKPEGPAEAAAMGEAIRLLARVLTPFAPHLADALTEGYGAQESTLVHGWPSFDPELVVDDVLPYAVQVNGKLRGEIRIAADAGESEVRAAAEAEEKVRAALAGKALRKVVFVPRRLINFVVG